MAFTSILPDPTHRINPAGQGGGPLRPAGPGYMSVKLKSSDPMISVKYNSQRYESQSGYYPLWEIDIQYNPLTCIEFHLLYAFLGLKRVTLEPFYVSIPPYEQQSLIGKTLENTAYKGVSVIDTLGIGALPGMIFNMAGTSKIYKITRVETHDINETDPGIGKERIHITPPMVETVIYNAALNFIDPLFRVIQTSDMSQYSLNKDGLFDFSLSLEEVY